MRGVASALASQADLTGSPRADIGVIESDEAAFPEIVRRVQPSVVLLNNLFRDQLDRYGELDTIAAQWAPRCDVAGGGDCRRQRRRPDAGRDHRGDRARRVTFGLDDRNPSFLLDEFRMPRTPRRADNVDGISPTTGCTAPTWSVALSGLRRERPPLDSAGRSIVLDGVDALRLESLAEEPDGSLPCS